MNCLSYRRPTSSVLYCIPGFLINLSLAAPRDPLDTNSLTPTSPFSRSKKILRKMHFIRQNTIIRSTPASHFKNHVGK